MNLAELWNTPGFFYAIGYSLALGVMLHHQPRKTGPRRLWGTWLAEWVFLSVLMQLTGGARGLRYVLTMITIIASMFLLCRYNLPDEARAGFVTIKAFICGELASSLCWQVCYDLARRFDRLQTLWGLNLTMFGTFIPIMVILWGVEHQLRIAGAQVTYTPRDIALEGLIGLSVYVVSNLGYLDSSTLFSGSGARDIFAIRTLVDLSGAILIYALQGQLIEAQARFERDALRSLRDMQYQSLQLTQESIELVNRKYHDLKHQIALLRAGALTDGGGALLDQMEGEIKQYEALSHTGNAVLDALLSVKGLYCLNHHIELKAMVEGEALSFMEDAEIAALFGNMLDNAIEAVEKIPDEERRLIRLNVLSERGFLRILLQNRCEAPPAFEDGLPLTTKRDGRYHGYGMKSMRHTVEKYSGSLVAAQEGEWFVVRILMPLTGEAAGSRGYGPG